MIDTGLQMLDWMWNRGWDKEHGGLLYFTSVNELPVQEYWHDMKFWWPHNEAVIATLLAYELTGNEKYLQWHQQVHQWAHKHFADPEHGEWYGYLLRDGRISSPLKGNSLERPVPPATDAIAMLGHSESHVVNATLSVNISRSEQSSEIESLVVLMKRK